MESFTDSPGFESLMHLFSNNPHLGPEIQGLTNWATNQCVDFNNKPFEQATRIQEISKLPFAEIASSRNFRVKVRFL